MSKTTVKSGFSKVFILAIVLLLPGFLYILLDKYGSNSYVTLPVYGEKKLSGDTIRKMGRDFLDTTYHTLDPISLNNWDGTHKGFLNTDSTTISIAHLYYLKDSVAARLMMNTMYDLSRSFIISPMAQFYSISVSPEDTSTNLLKFLNIYPEISKINWYVAEKPETVNILQYAQQQMLIDAVQNSEDSTKFILSNKFLLIDSKHRIRGFYEMAQKAEMDRLKDEIKVLLVEEIRNKSNTIEQKLN